jgi:hypothetical protein
LLADIPYLNAAGHAEDPWYATDERIDVVNQLHREIAAKVAGLGFPVGVAESTKYYDLLDGLSNDNIHPNDTGHAQIARGINESIKYSEGYELPQLSLGVRKRIKDANTNASTAATQSTTAATQATTAAAEVVKIQRAASAVTAGAPQERYIENAGGTKLQTIYEVHEGDKA